MKVLNYLAVVIFVVLIFYLLFIGKDLLLPLVIAIALWYLILTLGNAFSRVSIGQFQFPRPVCLLASFFTFIALAWLVINFLSTTVDDVLEIAPVYQQNLNARLVNTKDRVSDSFCPPGSIFLLTRDLLRLR